MKAGGAKAPPADFWEEGVMSSVVGCLKRLVPSRCRAFKKLERGGKPYEFDRWDEDQEGRECMYYKFRDKTGAKWNMKRVLLSEFERVVALTRTKGSLTRKMFEANCPVTDGDGPCGYAVVGRCLEILGIAVYKGRNSGFVTKREV
jgi:hypothetical protein